MSHAHVHDHSLPHLHDHSHPSHQGRLRWALVLTAAFFVAEVFGGVISNSLALLADAGHMFTDVGALALSLFVAWFSRQPAAPEKTYGYLRLEILAALLNGAVLLLVSGLIVWEAIGRLQSPEPLQGGLMLAVASGGLLINAASAAILHPVHGHSLNARGAYLHVLGDLLGSVGTVIAAIVVQTTGWLAADPIASIVVTLLVVRSAWRLVREAVDVLLEATPAHISLGSVREGLQQIAGIESVHDLHVWTVTSGMVAMSAHAVVKEPGENQKVLEAAVAAMRRLGISHVTLQVERDPICEAPCP
jgi:cobalt-zinc-cadmium efflux system protein